MSRLWGLALLWLALVAPSLAAGTPGTAVLHLDPLVARLDLSERGPATGIGILRDPGRQLSFSEVIGQLDRFQPAGRRDLVTSFNPGAFWLHCTLHNDGNAPLLRWLVAGNAKTQRVTLHIGENGNWQILKSGRNIALLEKPIATLEPAFPITIPPGKSVELLLHIDSQGATDMTPVIWEPAAYHHEASAELMQQSLLLGGLLISSVLSLMAFARLRENQYLWLGLLLVGVAGLEASRENFLGTYIWPAHLPTPPQVLAFFALIALFGISKVVSHVLELPTRMPRAARFLFGLRWIAVAGALISLPSYGHGVRIMSAASIVQNIAILILSLLALRHKHLKARIFPAAFGLALLTEISRQLANLGILPWISAMDFSTHLFLLATPLILLGLVEQTRELSTRLRVVEEIQEAKSAFFARISHELRAPLNTILGYSRMLARGSTRLSLAEGTQGIEKNSLRLLRLIDEVLDDARASAGQLHVSPAPMNLGDWLHETGKAMRFHTENSGNRFACISTGPLDQTISADGERLRQVIGNLVANANRHTHQGNISLSCAARQTNKGLRLDFAVRDDGEGIEPKQLQKIFEAFARGSSDARGHGLGLSICRELVRQMHGEITVSSTLGKGSVFSFAIECPLIHETRLPPATAAANADAGYQILLIGDNPIELDLLSKHIEYLGMSLTACLHSDQALDLIRERHWDLIMTDQVMPEIGGWEILECARTAQPATPVVLVSTIAATRPVNFPADLNFDATLTKPVAFEQTVGTACSLALRNRLAGTLIRETDWLQLAQLANEGDVSGLEDWLTAEKAAYPGAYPVLRTIEQIAHGLDFSLLEALFKALETGRQRLLHQGG